jgi:hypothetical protein
VTAVIGLIVAGGVAMAANDVVQTASIAFIARGRRVLASGFHNLSDLTGLCSLGAPLAVIATQHVSPLSALALVSMSCGSWVGTFAGMWLANRLCIDPVGVIHGR